MTALVLAGLLAIAQQQTQTPPPPQPRPNPCEASEFRHFDFWIGNWDVTNADGTRPLGTNLIESIAGRCGVQENWVGAGGGSGRSLNTYVRADGKWHQVWVGMGGGILHLIGGLQDGAMVLEGPSPGPNNTTVKNRVTWTPLADGRVRQHWQTSTDEGKTWTTTFDGYYKKKVSGGASPSRAPGPHAR